MNPIPTGALIEIIERLDLQLKQMRRFANNGPDNGSAERMEVYAKLGRDIVRCDKDLIELEQILALVNEYNEAHENGTN